MTGRPSLFRNAPLIAPRTVCGSHPKALLICGMVAPSGRWSMSIRRCCVDLRFVADATGLAVLAFGLRVAIYDLPGTPAGCRASMDALVARRIKRMLDHSMALFGGFRLHDCSWASPLGLFNLARTVSGSRGTVGADLEKKENSRDPTGECGRADRRARRIRQTVGALGPRRANLRRRVVRSPDRRPSRPRRACRRAWDRCGRYDVPRRRNLPAPESTAARRVRRRCRAQSL